MPECCPVLQAIPGISGSDETLVSRLTPMQAFNIIAVESILVLDCSLAEGDVDKRVLGCARIGDQGLPGEQKHLEDNFTSTLAWVMEEIPPDDEQRALLLYDDEDRVEFLTRWLLENNSCRVQHVSSIHRDTLLAGEKTRMEEHREQPIKLKHQRHSLHDSFRFSQSLLSCSTPPLIISACPMQFTTTTKTAGVSLSDLPQLPTSLHAQCWE